ncbi:MAG: transcriptional repressor [Muribaculaceae bacterium]|nr:transcriptional repressor [Muribaculaceae bacterium]
MNTPHTGEDVGKRIMERFIRYLESRNMRKTPERFAVLRRAMSFSGHFSGNDLHAMMEEDGFHVSRATVYHVLDILCECGLVNRLNLGTRSVCYEMVLSSHLHLVCMQCGRVDEIEAPALETLSREIIPDDFRPSFFTASIYGLCKDCRKGMTEQTDNTNL